MTTKLEIISTKNPNKPTIKAEIENKTYFLYSKYNPDKDSQLFAEKNYDKDSKNYLVYGLGLGYHIIELENLVKQNQKYFHIYVVECNKDLINLAKNNVNFDKIINNKNITFLEMKNDKSSYNKIQDIISLDNIKLAIHRPSMNIIPEEFIRFKYLLEEYIMKENNIERFSSILDENFKSNIRNYNYNIDKLFGKYKDKSLYLVSAGPSLDKNIHELKKVRDNDIVFSVGRAVRPLLKANIVPDYIIITDPSERLYDMQLKGLDMDVPIIVLSTCDKNVMLEYKGVKYIALQNGYYPAEEYAEKKGNLLVETGGSVATTALDVAIRMGFSRIVFVGQDLAFTDNKTHSRDTFSKSIKQDHNLRDTQDVNGKTIRTSKNLYIYLRWIQNRMKEEKDIEFIDATEGGARIMGTKVMKLESAIYKNNHNT